jgi:hypothetical protein
MTLPTPDQLQYEFDTATTERTPHFNWLPPEWIDAKPDLNKDRNTIATEPIFKNPTPLNCVVKMDGRIKELKGKFPKQIDHVKCSRALEQAVGEDTNPKMNKMPHPGSDFGHVDPGIYDSTEVAAFQAAFEALESLDPCSVKDGEMAKTFKQLLPPISRARDLIGADPRGMQRLKMAFEFALCNVTSLFGELNAALLNTNPVDGKREYNEARRKYIDLVRDLDDHEPRKEEMVPGERGYGRTLKWIYIRPLIHNGQIKGAKIVAKWNPHISSSGIPIPHS